MESYAIGRKIKDLRKKLGMTTGELAGRAGISQAQISRLENGRQGFRSKTLERIAEALGVKPVYFFIEENKGRGEELPHVYGLLAGGEFVAALSSPEFVRVAERLAQAFLHEREAFSAIGLAAKAILNR